MTTYSDEEWADIRATGSPGPRPRPAAGEVVDATVCASCGHACGVHDLDRDRCADGGPDLCPCRRFEVAS